jgi:hypothetical protein
MANRTICSNSPGKSLATVVTGRGDRMINVYIVHTLVALVHTVDAQLDVH